MLKELQLDPPKDDPISISELAKCDGKCLFSSKLSSDIQILLYKKKSASPR